MEEQAPARTVLVTGASSGIGRATALELAARGDDLVLVSRSREALEEVAHEVRDAGVRAVVAVADVTDPSAVADAFRTGREQLGRVDGVVHAAAVLSYGKFTDVPVEVFDHTVTTNVLGTAHVAREALTHFEENGGGSLVVVGSLLGRIVAPLMSGYVTSKWAVHGLVRTLQVEARHMPGVGISLVSPGGVNTPVYLQAGTYLERHGRPPPPVDSPEKVARAIVGALDRPRRHISVGAFNMVESLGFRLLPGLFDRLVGPLFNVAGLSGRNIAATPGNVFEPQPEGEDLHGRWGGRWGGHGPQR